MSAKSIAAVEASSIQDAGRYLRVVTESDGETVHNAFLDRRFKP